MAIWRELGPLGERHGERELGPLPAGQRSGPLLGVQADLPDPPLRQLVVPARVEPGTQPEVIRSSSQPGLRQAPSRR
jgi:hypothetical protein